jgi:hypothetical protein
MHQEGNCSDVGQRGFISPNNGQNYGVDSMCLYFLSLKSLREGHEFGLNFIKILYSTLSHSLMSSTESTIRIEPNYFPVFGWRGQRIEESPC